MIKTTFLTLAIIAGASMSSSGTNPNQFFLRNSGQIESPDKANGPIFETPEKEKAYLRSILETDKDTILVFLHGGLNSRRASTKRSTELTKFLATYQPGVHPVFVNWNSGGLSTYTEHLFFHRNGQRWKIGGPLTSPFVLLEDAGRALTRLPKGVVQTGNNYRKTYKFASTLSGRNAFKINALAPSQTQFGSLTQIDDRRTWSRVAWQNTASLIPHTVATGGNVLVDLLGFGAWRAMQRRTDLMFELETPDTADSYTSLEEYKNRRRGGIHNLLSVLAEIQRDSGSKKTIVLVGHSMGTIIANKMLQANSDLNISKIIYMGAACSIQEFQNSVIPFVNKHRSTQFYNLTLDPLAENGETTFLGVGGSGSLLVQIDNMYESPVSTNRRTLGRWENVMNGINYFMYDKDGVMYKRDGNETPLSKQIHLLTMPYAKGKYPVKHGQFDDIPLLNSDYGLLLQQVIGGQSIVKAP